MLKLMFENLRETRLNVLIGLWILGNLSPAFAAQSVQPSTANYGNEKTQEIADAKTVAAELKGVWLNQQRLAQLGSISQQKLRVSEFKYKLAELRVLSLEYPEWNRRIAVSRAKLVLDFRSKELEMLDTLYRRGSVSEAHIRRARTARDIAKLNYEFAVDGDADKLHSFRVARANLTLASDLHARAVRLFRSGAISRPDFDRVSRKLLMAEEGLLLAKKNLGIRVIQVPDSSRTPANRK